MVYLWPWKGDDASPASFERALSTLSTKIATSTAQLDSLRQRLRRLKALWTLYAIFAYILVALILILVVGWQHWGAIEYAAVAGGPPLIYAVRTLITAYYNYRLSHITSRLEEQQKERDATIEKLKAATKYNSTQQLLDKYGGSSAQSSPASGGSQKRKTGSRPSNPGTPQGRPQRIGFMPPPTANIARHTPPTLPSTPQRSLPFPPHVDSPALAQRSHDTPIQPGPPEFAPNAFSGPRRYSGSAEPGPSHWYDRILDVLLGEDETSPQNRMALICQQCRLVNGQAPAGVKSLEELGRWKCTSCGAWNGEENEAKKLVDEMKGRLRVDAASERSGSDDDVVVVPPGEDAMDTTSDNAEVEAEADDGRKSSEGQEDRERPSFTFLELTHGNPFGRTKAGWFDLPSI
ncbi:MAG: hypothetical protein M1838_004093 [Thelocarpon superellum]|nr:MAG: hypothetical protein M1838_004093 [Thelocarpon superellum]